MVTKGVFVGALLALTDSVVSKPMTYGTEHMTVEQVGNITQTIDRQMLEAFGCTGQSCLIADTAGSTGQVPTMKAEGASDADIKCIVHYNPVIGDLLKAYDGKPPPGPKQDTGVMSSIMGGLNSLWRPIVAATGSTDKGSFTGTCSKNILIFAKGTMEPGAYGIMVGPSFTANLGAGWTTYPVAYDADIPGDYCLGLPGGMVAKDIINQAATKCPNANLFLSGYSQGAMVVRNGVAQADESAKSHVKGVITFGDPFNGAPIKGYNGPIEIYCNKGDGVCTGNFEPAAAHMSYGGASAKAKLQELARKASRS